VHDADGWLFKRLPHLPLTVMGACVGCGTAGPVMSYVMPGYRVPPRGKLMTPTGPSRPEPLCQTCALGFILANWPHVNEAGELAIAAARRNPLEYSHGS
jgi:hypothetical protein